MEEVALVQRSVQDEAGASLPGPKRPYICEDFRVEGLGFGFRGKEVR